MKKSEKKTYHSIVYNFLWLCGFLWRDELLKLYYMGNDLMALSLKHIKCQPTYQLDS